MKSYIYINRHKVQKNKKENKDKPVIAVRSYKGIEYTKRVTFSDGSQLKQDFKNPLCSGATIWLESERENIILD